MFALFTALADWLTYSILALSPRTQLAEAVHFFIEDVSKIFALLLVMIYFIALLRASMNVERVRDYLAGKHQFLAYGSASVFGAVTPFCSCSSIPVFLGFTTAGIPLGITMAFLITSPLVNEVAVVLLWGLLGWKLTLWYVVIGITIGILCGWLLDKIRADRWLQLFVSDALNQAHSAPTTRASSDAIQMTLNQRHQFAKGEVRAIVSRVWKWVIIGVGVGAGLHGFVPAGWLTDSLGSGQWWSVPAAVLVGIPLYSNATGIIPVMESLLTNGLPLGTTLAFCMSTVAASVPEFFMLKQVMQWRLLALLFGLLLAAFTLIGWLFNLIILL
ncbi:permease [Vibrio fluvialis]|nr:permease [Vibrio fluvialis]ELO1814603.1 permease [Vibrio fluvialis]